MYSKRQIIESQKRYEVIHDLLSQKANIKETGISWEDGQIYFRDGYKEYILATFWDYKSLKAAQDYLIRLLKSVDHIIEVKHDQILNKINYKEL